MPLFEYTARNAANGQIQKGQVEVKSKEEVSAYLRKNRMILVNVREAPTKISLGGALGKGKVKTRDIVIFTRQFATMINAGLPLVQSLSILAAQTENKTLQEVTKAVVHDVEAGNTLADAFSKHPRAFSALYVNMVAAGEAGCILDTILIRLATFLEKSDALILRISASLFSRKVARRIRMVSRIQPASPAATMLTYKALNARGCLENASASVLPASTSCTTALVTSCSVLFSVWAARMLSDWTSGKPALIIVANCRVKITMSRVLTLPLPRAPPRLILVGASRTLTRIIRFFRR